MLSAQSFLGCSSGSVEDENDERRQRMEAWLMALQRRASTLSGSFM